jgi:hypothetical protein
MRLHIRVRPGGCFNQPVTIPNEDRTQNVTDRRLILDDQDASLCVREHIRAMKLSPARVIAL